MARKSDQKPPLDDMQDWLVIGVIVGGSTLVAWLAAWSGVLHM